MTLISLLCFGICAGIGISVLRRNADPLSPARLFGFIWSLAIGLADFKFSAYQHEWDPVGWILLLIGLGSFLLGTFIANVLNLDGKQLPVCAMRLKLGGESVFEGRLFWLISLSVAVYAVSYLANYLVKGWLPFFVVGKNISRVDFNVSGLTLFLYSPPYIIFSVVLYCIFVVGHRTRKTILLVMSVVTLASFLLLLQRYQIIMAATICFILLYYATPYIRFRTAFPFFAIVGGFFFWVSSLRLSHVVSTFMYSASKMKFSKDYAMLTEPYMYMVMNLENFARSVSLSDHHTYGYFTFDFITAIT
ncbi:MAG: oligosaccharide repeat unit polymerase, partial [Bacteroidota bacterium]